MDSLDKLPDEEVKPVGELSKKFLELGITTFKAACHHVHEMEYGSNTNYKDKMILFKENKGTCTSKHAVIAGLARELNVPVYKHICVYKFTDEITTGAGEILKKYEIPYVPLIHCFLKFFKYRFDLTEGNKNGKKKPIDEYIHDERVEPFISIYDEYIIYKKILKEKILPSKEMEGIKEKSILKARAESLLLLKTCVER
jgi:hypothetical protein